MISYVTGNLFESPAQTLVNTVNTVGVMGKGIALTFKQIYPEMFREYRDLCEARELSIGSLHLYRTPNKLILNFPTKKHWRNPSKPEYIEAGLETFVQRYEKMGIHSVAFPPLGCGNGELDFETVVRPIMEFYLSDLPISVYVYAPHKQVGPPEHRVPSEIRKWLQSAPSDLSFDEVWFDIRAILNGKDVFKTLARGSRYTAKMVDKDRVRITAAGKSMIVDHSEFLELWKQLRDFGILTPNNVPANRQKDASYLLPLFAELPYVREVALGATYADFSRSPTWGLQVLPGGRDESEPQMELI
jgi:O-acetyl-ADP-ribose deacetylase (regulator of RNase III)